MKPDGTPVSRIDRIEPLLVDRCLLVRVYTSDGLVGTGEAGLWAHHRLVLEAINDLADYFVGKDAGLIEHHFQAVTRDAHFPGPILFAALSAIDIALWDILGQSVGKPVHALLGGACRSRVRVFAAVTGDTVAEHVAQAEAAVAAGYTSIRTMPFLRDWEKETPTAYIGTAVEITAAVRQAIGYSIDLGVEIHRNLLPDEAIILARELEPLRLLYYEDPVAPESLPALEYVARHVDIPIAFGERSYALPQFKDLIDTGAVSMIRPDLSLAGGFTQCRKIAAYAEASFVGVFPHLMGSPVNVAAFVQFAASIPNYAVMESGSSFLDEIVDLPLSVEAGHLAVPDRPGIGVSLREEALARFPYRPHRIGASTRADGSVAH
jgi:galactonate dehydratase